MGTKKKDENEHSSPKSGNMKAKKDWVLCWNKVNHKIKKGDDVSKLKLQDNLIDCLRKEEVL